MNRSVSKITILKSAVIVFGALAAAAGFSGFGSYGQQTLATSSLESRSRAEFAYGKPLGIGAAEVIDAIASHIAGELSKIPETVSTPERTLPPVSVTSPTTPATPETPQVEDPYMASASSNVALSSSE